MGDKLDIQELKHYGIKRRSGRYPWGSGENPRQRRDSFLGRALELKQKGYSDAEIAKAMGMKTTELRRRRSYAQAEARAEQAALALRLKEKGYSNVAIGKRIGINESSVRSLLDPALREKNAILKNTSKMLKANVDERGIIDIGVGTENHLGISRDKLLTSVQELKDEGYNVYYFKEKQVGTGKYTTIQVLAPPDMDYSTAYKNRDATAVINHYTEDGGRTFRGLEPVRSISSDRVLIRYGDEGGTDRDGVIQLRPGVEDLDLGDAHYAQVRISVDGTHFMKGMAMHGFNKDFPDGVDIIYNTKKKKGTPSEDVFKEYTDDPDNPFKTTVRQLHYIDKNGKEQLSALNIVGSKDIAGVEGGWENWSRNLSSQVLSKQTPALAKRQLKIALDMQKEEYDEIMSLTNPAVKKALLQTYSDGADAAAVHLKAAALPRQGTHVLLPFPDMNPKEVYAPNYRDGETVVLIRHPHGGIFEIPTVTVNNRISSARSLLGRAKDAIGIHPDVAQRLSGADFDGDTVIVIPNKNRDIMTSAPLKGLKDFDPITSYPKVKGMRVMDASTKQLKMGDVSNLITDMTIKGATPNEIARAVRHSMVVIDAEKHELNYQLSYRENGIAALKEKYQGRKNAGASTIISKAGSKLYIPEREEGRYITDPKTGKKRRVYIDPKTGKKLYSPTGREFIVDGQVVKPHTKTTWMAEVDDAHTLSSGTAMEKIYADHANALKSLANRARLSMINTPNTVYSRAARETYSKEVSKLNAKLREAYRNKPLERKATLLANSWIKAKKAAHPEMTPGDLKKLKGQMLEEARARVGAKKKKIVITDREWEAIQAGAISNNKLNKILQNTDIDAIKVRAMPRATRGLSPARTARARLMLDAGHTQREVADALGVSVSVVSDAVAE